VFGVLMMKSAFSESNDEFRDLSSSASYDFCAAEHLYGIRYTAANRAIGDPVLAANNVPIL